MVTALYSDSRVFFYTDSSDVKFPTISKSARFFGAGHLDAVKAEALTLYKTGRTQAKDGGIDFVMRPLGRFFQVTETIDVNKYFLDIDKIQRFPLTFVVKSDVHEKMILRSIEMQAKAKYRSRKMAQKSAI